jgi:hypothetical protein
MLSPDSMSKPKQAIQWTLLPNGVRDGVLRFSVFVSIQLTNPTELPGLNLSGYPDLVNWPETLDRMSFSLVFEDGATLSETPDRRRPQPNALERVTYRPFPSHRNLWFEIFSPDATQVNSSETFAVAANQPVARTGVATYSSRSILSVAQAQYRFTPLAAVTAAAPLALTARANDQFSTIRAQDPQATDIFREIRNRLPLLPARGAAPQALSADQLPSRLFDPAPGYTAAEWHLGLVLFYLEGLRPPQTENAASVETLEEFKAKLAIVSGYPELMRRLGLVIDFKLPLAAVASIPPTGRVAIRPDWKPHASVDATNLTPWTRYAFDPGPHYFEAAPRRGNSQNGYPVNAEIFHGMLNLSLHDQDQPCFQLEQIDPLAEALKLNHFVRSPEPDPVRRNQLLGTPRAVGLSLLQQCYADQFFERIAKALENQASAATDNSPDITLWAEDLVRGYRPDIQTDDGRWHALCERVGIYELHSGDEIEIEDEGWVSSCAASDAKDPSVLLVSDTIVRWDGWSMAAPLPGRKIPSDVSPQAPPPSPFLKVRFSPRPHSLPRLRFGRKYRMRIRLVDVAGNGLELKDEAANHWRGILPEQDSPAYVYRRFEPLLAPDVIPRSAPDEKHGASVFKLVIRSDYNIACKELEERHFAPAKCSELFAELHERFDRKGSGPSSDAYSMLVKFDSSAPPLWDKSQYHPPYLTDPLVRAIVLHDVPGTEGKPVILPITDSHDRWPSVKPWRIRILEDPDGPDEPGASPPNYRAPSIDRDHGVLTVYLPKAEICTIRVNCQLVEDDLPVMGLWHWIQRSFPEHQDFFRNLILRGDHWMFTPNREIDLVHAVALPLYKPRFEPLDDAEPDTRIRVIRSPGATNAKIITRVAAPGRSAARLSMQAAWTEWLDDGLPGSQVSRVERTAHAFDQSLNYADAVLPFGGTHDFGDTRHRLISYTAVAATRFTEYFKAPAGIQTSAPLSVHVPSTAAPPTPSVLYAVPIFGWEAQVNAGPQVTRLRRGGGLRIYLNRPWYRSGDDELLGVIVAPSEAPEMPKTSRWGRDPLGTNIGPGAFTEAELMGNIPHRKTLPWANGSANVRVLGHAVTYDTERKLWFADVIVNPHESYFPFIQLALCRFQPYSLDKLEISPVVMADFAQLAPDRTASLVVDPDGPGHTLRVRLGGKALTPRNRAEVIVERARPGMDRSVQWEPVNETPYAMTFRTAGDQGSFWECAEVPLPFGERSLQVMIVEREVWSQDPQDEGRVVYVGRLTL